MDKKSGLQTVEVYDSFRSDVLLEIKFQRGEGNSLVRTFRSTYYSIRQLLDGSLTPRYEQQELNLQFKINGAQLRQFAS